MANLQLAFLGVPEVHDNDRIMTLPTRKALALLVYLAVEGGVQPRDHLTALLWPESDALRGRAALRKTLGYLKQGIGGELATLTATRDALQLEPGPEIQVDVWQIAAAASSHQRPQRNGPGGSRVCLIIKCSFWGRGLDLIPPVIRANRKSSRQSGEGNVYSSRTICVGS